ncbi:SDR family oxidoreductase [Cryobacterium arcticum]|uniref:NAD-dependent dehydratase n=1 Tax=Cryobacterium arcticum TaxID=670052 RepID=A0A1B1BM14_9MICO|nr:SDR family oxidoreductase [Cryobacterium arcticum]ANP73571.1 NAD-dependent dehydratase [Cryobacterium arcticum]
MSGLRVLIVGGTGIISSAVVAEALRKGHDVHTLTRSGTNPQPSVTTAHRADVRDGRSVERAIAGLHFDAVVQFVAFEAEHVRADIAIFSGHTDQYIFISSASAYQTPPRSLPVTESTPLRNPYWEYSRNKIACEDELVAAYRHSGFPVTIVRPSHTYNHTMVPFDGGWTVVERMRQGRPVVVPGDGTSLWTITHHTDFARGFVGLFGRDEAIGEAFHITSDEALTWNAIYEHIARAAGVQPDLVHIASTAIAAADPVWGAALLGDKANSMVFDNTKIKRLVPEFTCRVPFARGAEEIIAWHDEHPEARVTDPGVDAVMDALVEAYRPRSPLQSRSPLSTL